MVIRELRERNNKLLEENKNNSSIYEKQLLIKKVLNEDKCFFKINIDDAYMILHELGYEEKDFKNIYEQLLDSKNYL